MNLNFSKIMPQQAHSKRTWKDRLPYLLAFFIPVLSMIMFFIGKEIYPFGDRSFLRTDLYHLYAPFFQELKDKLANGESLFKYQVIVRLESAIFNTIPYVINSMTSELGHRNKNQLSGLER